MIDTVGRKIERPLIETSEAVSTPKNGNFAKNYPALQDFLERKRGSHSYHKTGSATLFVDGELYKLCLNDRPLNRSCFVSASSMVKLFQTADTGLANNRLEWRTKGYKVPK